VGIGAKHDSVALSRATSGPERERISALTAGLAATVITWTFAAGFASEKLETLARYSPWLYGPALTAAWALFSAIAYLFIRRSRHPRARRDVDESYRCSELRASASAIGSSICANQDEKDRLGAVSAGFALTISAWVAMLSFMPENWLDSLGQAPAWIYCIASVILWATLSASTYLIFRASHRRPS
jgi:hypothetical protein